MKQLSVEEARTYLLERARSQGVSLEVYALRGSGTTIQTFEGQLSDFKRSSQQGVGLRALVNGAYGYASSENLSTEALDRTLQAATQNAALTAPQPGAGLHAWGKPPELDLHGEGLSGVSVAEKVQLAAAMEQTARKTDGRVTSVPYNTYSDTDGETLIGNTEGLERGYKELSASLFSAPLVSEDGQNKMKYEYQFSREFHSLDPTQTALDATRKALALLGARPAPSGHYPAVLAPEAMLLLLAVFGGMFSAKAVQEGKSPLAGRLGEHIGNEQVTLIDDATLPSGPVSRPFDAEGCPSAPLTLLDAGVLKSYLHNAQTAAVDGTHSTGHASRQGYTGTVSVGYSNLYLQPGRASEAELRAGLTGVLVTGLEGGHAGADPITGDFSLQAEGFWLQNGEVAHPLDVFTVAGNFLELLNSVEAVGSDLTWTYHSTGSPSVRLPQLAVGGQ